MTYRFDDLGWFQFEQLVQALMKAWLGPGVESWGGSGDIGRDCYCPLPLAYPGVQKSDGPFVFQAKFVAGANAAGAKPENALIKAVTAEASRILARIESEVWDQPAFYILVTNCPVTQGLRDRVTGILKKICPESTITVLGSADLNSLLASHPEIRRSFPQLLGLADLSLLLSQQVNSELLERSAAAMSLATGLEKVFVPTAAFEKARAILVKHHFVVLEGPPEMGKTAIARILGLIKLLDQREVYECKTPTDFFKVYDKGQRQFFIADDAFGRTEYDPSLGKLWEQDLEKILLRLDVTHELCWTSRKHILERALRKMDLQGKAAKLPRPSAVLVDASKLDLRDKTLMLLRHTQSASCTTPEIKLVQKMGRQIVQDAHFTPERIRRFVADVLPNLESDQQNVVAQVRQAIADPTVSMRKSFAALSPGHRLLLYCMVELQWWDGVKALERAFVEALGTFGVAENFSDVCEELIGSFLKELQLRDEMGVDWIHPSVRDLVIEQLMMSSIDRERFLSRGGTRCFVLALSAVGGSEGKRACPLLRTDGDWKLLQQLVTRVIENPTTERGDILSIIETTLEVDGGNFETKDHLMFEMIIREIFKLVRNRVSSAPALLNLDLYRNLCELSVTLSPMELPPLPTHLWNEACGFAMSNIASKDSFTVATDALPLLSLLGLLHRYEPRFLMAERYPEAMESGLRELMLRLDKFEVGMSEYSLEDEKDALTGTVRAMRRLAEQNTPGGDWSATQAILEKRIEECDSKMSEEDRPEDDDDDENAGLRDQSAFTVDMIDSVLADLGQ